MNTAQDVRTRVIELIAERVHRDPAHIMPEHSFVSDFAFDSLESVEMVMELEDAFEFQITDSEAEQLLTVQDVIDLVKRKRNLDA